MLLLTSTDANLCNLNAENLEHLRNSKSGKNTIKATTKDILMQNSCVRFHMCSSIEKVIQTVDIETVRDRGGRKAAQSELIKKWESCF